MSDWGGALARALPGGGRNLAKVGGGWKTSNIEVRKSGSVRVGVQNRNIARVGGSNPDTQERSGYNALRQRRNEQERVKKGMTSNDAVMSFVPLVYPFEAPRIS